MPDFDQSFESTLPKNITPTIAPICTRQPTTKHFGFWVVLRLFGALVVLGFTIGLATGSAQPVAATFLTHPWDKVAHALVFGLLATILGVTFISAHRLQNRTRANTNRALLMAALLTMLVAGVDEVHQLWLPGRMADWADWFADMAGMAIGLACLGWLLRRSRF